MGLVGRAWRSRAARSVSRVGSGAGRTSRRNHCAARGSGATFWELDPERAIGINRSGQRLKLRPFMGIMGMPLDQPGIQSTFPPTRCGGNLDCRELTEGTVLFLPIAVDGGLFSTGDGHAVQGDGEVAGPALNCPMQVEMEFRLLSDSLHAAFFKDNSVPHGGTSNDKCR